MNNRPNCVNDPVVMRDIYMTEYELRYYARSLCSDCPTFALCEAGQPDDKEWRIRAGITGQEYRTRVKMGASQQRDTDPKGSRT